MRDLLGTHGHAFWQERICKERAVRVAWHASYGHRAWKAMPLQRKQVQKTPLGAVPAPQRKCPKPQETREQTSRKAGIPGTPPQASSTDREARTAPPPPDPSESLEMRKAPARVLQLLYREGQGAAAYLRERHRQKPEEKFRYPILSSWEYGWHAGKVAILLPAGPGL